MKIKRHLITLIFGYLYCSSLLASTLTITDFSSVESVSTNIAISPQLRLNQTTNALTTGTGGNIFAQDYRGAVSFSNQDSNQE